MRKIAANALAIPVLVVLYVPILLRRSVALRLVVGVGLVAVLGLSLVAIGSPKPIAAAVPPTTAPVDAAAFAQAIDAHHGLHAPVSLSFSGPMNEASVVAALTVVPATAVTTSWDAGARTLTIRPKGMWLTATFYTIKVDTAALDAHGRPLARAARALFSTRAATVARLALTRPAGLAAAPSTGITVSFDEGVQVPAAADALLAISPAVDGSLTSVATTASGTTVTFQPDQPLAAGMTYTIAVQAGVVDDDGSSVTLPPALEVKTAAAPAIVRFRPLNGTTQVLPSAKLSVRFSEAMDPALAGPAFSATIGGQALAGKVAWAEDNTVLVFSPTTAMTRGATVTMTVSTAAQSAGGVALVKAGSVSFTTVAPVAVAIAPKKAAPKAKPPVAKTGSGGGSTGAGAWHAVEVYYLGLMNCTRGGGWILASGRCSSPGGSGVKPLILNAGISNKVSRPYAKFLAVHNICSHFADGNPGDRLHRAGYPGDYRENIGCRSNSNPYASVLGTHLFFQDEKPCSDYCHWANIMDSRMTQVGIGIWVIGDRVRLVVDFWKG